MSEITKNLISPKDRIKAIHSILGKALSLRGYTLSELTNILKVHNPSNLVHAKGLTGQIIEILLGATAKSKPLPDFPELNLEIKTLPIDLKHNPLETTYVCTAPLLNKNLHKNLFDFKDSVVYKKLKQVLWVPIITSKTNHNSAIKQQVDRTVGNSFLWSPNSEELKQIQNDWLELTEMLHLGDINKVSSHFGEVLQIRPKAANSSCTTTGIGSDGQYITTLPRGYYLRTSFTKHLIDKYGKACNILP